MGVSLSRVGGDRSVWGGVSLSRVRGQSVRGWGYVCHGWEEVGPSGVGVYLSVTGGRKSVCPRVGVSPSRVGGGQGPWVPRKPSDGAPAPHGGRGGGGGRTPGAAARPSGTPSPSLPPSPFPPGVGRPRTREAEEVGAVAIGPQRLYQPAALRALPGAVHPLQHNQRATPARHSARRRSPPAPSAAAVRPIPATVVVPAPPPPAPRCARRRKGTETPRSSRKAGRLRGAKERLRPPPALPLMNMQRERPRRPMSAGRAMNMG